MTLNECTCENPEIEEREMLPGAIEKVVKCVSCGASKIEWKITQ